ncbi:MAG: thiamine phosphate synthase [Flavobacteriales bacterium]|nr:thiamine phosphate synthase [Flavobacteriales bacterium]
MISRLQYITQDHPSKSHATLAMEACMAGANWIQLRMKSASDEEVELEGIRIREITDKYGANFILNDRIHLVEKCNADGVHLGLKDMSTNEARSFLGFDKIIGGTANTLEDVIAHATNKVDYVGLGPFQFTETKRSLSQTLGTSGYVEIIGGLKEIGIKLPVIAIGGIKEGDILKIMETGITGVAVSGLITNAVNKPELINRINNIQYAYNSEQTV